MFDQCRCVWCLACLPRLTACIPSSVICCKQLPCVRASVLVFFPYSFFFLSVKFFLSLSLTLYIICTWSPGGWLNGLSSGNRTTIDTLSLIPAANFLLSTPAANPNICLWASSFTSNFVPTSSGAQRMKECELLSQPETIHWKYFFYLVACLFTVHEFIENVPAK